MTACKSSIPATLNNHFIIVRFSPSKRACTVIIQGNIIEQLFFLEFNFFNDYQGYSTIFVHCPQNPAVPGSSEFICSGFKTDKIILIEPSFNNEVNGPCGFTTDNI